MIRSLITISAVAAISCCLARYEHAQGRLPESTDWVRTADGWESSAVLEMEPVGQIDPALHPALVAGFLLGASLFALLAFPCRARESKQVPRPVGRVKRVRVRRPRPRVVSQAR